VNRPGVGQGRAVHGKTTMNGEAVAARNRKGRGAEQRDASTVNHRHRNDGALVEDAGKVKSSTRRPGKRMPDRKKADS
jgi:hypothetical protein